MGEWFVKIMSIVVCVCIECSSLCSLASLEFGDSSNYEVGDRNNIKIS